MKAVYKLNISGTEVIFDMQQYSETITLLNNDSQLVDIHENEDYKLLYSFKMAKFANDQDLPEYDPVAKKYKHLYQELLNKVTERFPD